MLQSSRLLPFLQHLFDDARLAAKAAGIVAAILAARSPRLSDIAQHMAGTASANYKALQRFLAQADLQTALLRLFQPEAEFVIGDPTEIPRPQAYKTPYVGKLQDGKTRGFWLLVLATPFRGRALPFAALSYSSRTISQERTSRNQYHWQAFEPLKPLLGKRPLVLDREFSYLALLEYLVAAGLSFVIRLHLGSQPPTLTNAQGRKVPLVVGLGEAVIHRQLRYMGKVTVNVIGVWRKGHAHPLWVMSNLAPEHALQIYLARMKIEQTFKDLKSLLGLEKLMNKSQAQLHQMVALVLLAYSLGLLVGEALRDELFAAPEPEQPAAEDTETPSTRARSKWSLYSGLFILLKLKLSLSAQTLRALLARVLEVFVNLVHPIPVRT